MKIDVRALQDGKSVPFRYTSLLPPFDDFGRVLFPHPVEAEGSITNRRGTLVLEGTWSVWAEFRCDRCDAPFSRKLSGSVTSILNDEDDRTLPLPLDGGFCNLDAIIPPDVILAVETKNLCTDDCPGNPNWRCFDYGGPKE
ncbi:MAG: DUF177 domain-containing protein [Oscillospiraceae bacterium]|jgi:uncharacterized protein|nr:DUF177 domain-containing protein [Oscillospiraceae bacterium]